MTLQLALSTRTRTDSKMLPPYHIYNLVMKLLPRLQEGVTLIGVELVYI